MTDTADTSGINKRSLQGAMPRTGTMQVMDHSGHHTVSWNPDDPDEVANARTAFNEMIADNRFRAFRADEKGRQGERITTFDPTAARIVMVPQLRGG